MARRKRRRRKAQTSPAQYLQSSVSVVENTGRLGEKRRPFNYDVAVDSFRSWVFAAIKLNAAAVAAVPIRLYVRNKPGLRRTFRTRPVPPARKRYLLGESRGTLDQVRPAKSIIHKLHDLEDFEEVTERHPITDLLHDVNPFFNGFDLLELTTIYLETTGNAYWHPVIDANMGIPNEIWPMPAQWVWVIPDRETFLRGYVYGKGTEVQREFAPDEVIHFRTANPGRDGLYYGLGKIEAGWGVVELNRSQHEMDLAIAENGARPDYAVIVKSGATGKALDRFERQIDRKLRGERNAGKFLAVTGDVTLEPLNFPPKDIAWRTEVVEEIAAVFGTPVSLLRANDPNLASAQTGFAAWKANTILPLTKMIEQKLTETLLPLFGIEEDAVLAFDNPVPADKEFELRESTLLVTTGIKSRNEDREDRGLPPQEGGDELLVAGGLMPIDEAGQLGIGFGGGFGGGGGQFQPRVPLPSEGVGLNAREIATEVAKLLETERSPEQPPTEPPAEPIPPARAADESVDVCVDRLAPTLMARGMPFTQAATEARRLCQQIQEYTVFGPTNQPDTGGGGASGGAPPSAGLPNIPVLSMRDVWVKAQTQIDLPPIEREFHRSLRDIFGRQISRVMRWISQGRVNMDELRIMLSERQWTAELESAAKPFVREAIRAGGDIGAGKLGQIIGSDVGFDVTNPEVQRFVDEWVVRLAGQSQEVFRVELQDLIGDGLEQGEGIGDLTRRVQDWAAVEDPERGIGWRAERIARTESARAYVHGETQSWKQSGVVEAKKWLLSPRPCEFCIATAAIYHRGVPLDQPFWKLGATIVGSKGGVMDVDYTDVFGPPLHPNCRCDTIPVLKGEIA